MCLVCTKCDLVSIIWGIGTAAAALLPLYQHIGVVVNIYRSHSHSQSPPKDAFGCYFWTEEEGGGRCPLLLLHNESSARGCTASGEVLSWPRGVSRQDSCLSSKRPPTAVDSVF